MKNKPYTLMWIWVKKGPLSIVVTLDNGKCVIKDGVLICFVYQTVDKVEVHHVVVDRRAARYHSIHHVSGDHDPAERSRSLKALLLWMSVSDS